MKCAANLHSIGVAWRSYLVESKDTFPTWFANNQWFYGGKIEVYAVSAPPARRLLNPYVALDGWGNRSAEAFHCPSDNGARGPLPPAYTGVRTYDYYGNSFMLNTLLLRPVRPVRADEIRLPPSHFVLAGDQQWYWTTRGFGQYEAHWHGEQGLRVNLAYLDGHAAFTRLGWEEGQTSTYSFLFDWAPPEDNPEGD